jgi:hypothetical protein
MMFRAVFWVVTRQYNPEDSSEHHSYILFRETSASKSLPFETESCCIIFRNAVLTFNKAQRVSITQFSYVMLF